MAETLTQTTTKLQSLANFIEEKADKITGKALLKDWLIETFGTRLENAKNFLRSKEVSDEVYITGDYYKLGSTSGETRKNYKGEQIDEVVDYSFKNVPIFGELKK